MNKEKIKLIKYNKPSLTHNDIMVRLAEIKKKNEEILQDVVEKP